MNILKFITAGSVDDGKSTLIGRLLYDTNSILDDQLEAIKQVNRKNDDGTVDLAILTDGLKAEREQGITIDVAYKYFQTENRKFIIADAPGHIQYTRNMITGASNSDLIIILIDARKGITEQTKRHSFIAKILGLKRVLVCVNKMDMVDYNHSIYQSIMDDYIKLSDRLELSNVDFIPVSALKGDNIVNKSNAMGWYSGESLLDFLEKVEVDKGENTGWRLPVQWVLRPQCIDLHDYRGYSGKVLGEGLKLGEEVIVLPSGYRTRISAIEFGEKEIDFANDGASVIVHLVDEIDISRGDIIVGARNPPRIGRDLELNISWLDQKPLDLEQVYFFQTHSKLTKIKFSEIKYKFDVHTQDEIYDSQIGLNDIGRVRIKSAEDIIYDKPVDFLENSRGIIIDPRTNITVAAALVSEN